MEKKKRFDRVKGHTTNLAIVKFVLGAVGLSLYVYTGGTLLYAMFLYVIFGLMVQLAAACYHRWITHKVIEPTLVGKGILWFCLVSVGNLRPSTYAIIHRMHHKYSDTENDPHPTTVGLWRFMIGNYSYRPNNTEVDGKKIMFSVPILDLYRRKDIVFVDKYYWYLYAMTLIVFAFIDVQLAMLSFPFLVLRYHVQHAIFNYITHGGKEKQTPQDLNIFPGIFFFGEHLHKTHHLNQSLANYGSISKFNFDYMYYFLYHLKLIKRQNE